MNDGLIALGMRRFTVCSNPTWFCYVRWGKSINDDLERQHVWTWCCTLYHVNCWCECDVLKITIFSIRSPYWLCCLFRRAIYWLEVSFGLVLTRLLINFFAIGIHVWSKMEFYQVLESSSALWIRNLQLSFFLALLVIRYAPWVLFVVPGCRDYSAICMKSVNFHVLTNGVTMRLPSKFSISRFLPVIIPRNVRFLDPTVAVNVLNNLHYLKFQIIYHLLI